MEREQKQTEHVKAGYKIILETINHHRIHVIVPERIVLEQCKPTISYSHCEMRNMINDKRQHDEPVHQHVTLSECCFDVATVDVGLRLGMPVINFMLDRQLDVTNDLSMP